jgi:hypothetical protein
MVVRAQEGAEVDVHQEAGLLVDVHPLVAPRWGALATVGPCQAIVVPTAVVRLTPNLVEMAAVFAIDERRGMRAGSVLGVEIDPVVVLENDSEIDPVIDPVIAPESDSEIDPAVDPVTAPESDSEIDPAIDPMIVPESDLGIGPVPTTGIRMIFGPNLRTTVQGPDDFGIGMIVTATVVAPGMSGVSLPSAPDRASTMAVPNVRMQYRRPQRPHLRQMI